MNEENRNYKLQLISKYRTILMGISILMITFCHLDIARRYNGLPGIKLGSLLHLFTVGVDIFMFLSGFGLWYSLSNNNDAKTFLKKRIIKLLPKYIVIAGITYFLYDLIIAKHGFLKFVQDYTFLSWVLYGSTRYWFVAGILIFYIFFPLIFKVISNDAVKDRYKMFVFLIVFLAIVFFFDTHFERYRDFRIAIERLPVFILGALCAKYSDKTISRLHLGIMTAIGLIFTAVQMLSDPFQSWVSHTPYMYYLSRGLFAVSLMIVFILILEKLSGDTLSILQGGFTLLGTATYEIYLFHQSYMILLNFPPYLPGYILAAVIMPVFSGIILKSITKISKLEM
ncbi:MAG: acyltransferase [Erysipelotrichaceae bacterium]|nr:acyltransferase [Erysipelotrichaceae bacterium]